MLIEQWSFDPTAGGGGGGGGGGVTFEEILP